MPDANSGPALGDEAQLAVGTEKRNEDQKWADGATGEALVYEYTGKKDEGEWCKGRGILPLQLGASGDNLFPKLVSEEGTSYQIDTREAIGKKLLKNEYNIYMDAHKGTSVQVDEKLMCVNESLIQGNMVTFNDRDGQAILQAVKSAGSGGCLCFGGATQVFDVMAAGSKDVLWTFIRESKPKFTANGPQTTWRILNGKKKHCYTAEGTWKPKSDDTNNLYPGYKVFQQGGGEEPIARIKQYEALCPPLFRVKGSAGHDAGLLAVFFTIVDLNTNKAF